MAATAAGLVLAAGLALFVLVRRRRANRVEEVSSSPDVASSPMAEPEPEAAEPLIVAATPAAQCLERLQARGKLPPPAQRELFVKECSAGNAAVQLAAVVAKAAEGRTLTVVSANVYYGRCTDAATGSESISPETTLRAIEALLQSGADVVCMQEVVGGDAPEGQGKDDYGDFSKQFPKADFAPWPEEAKKFEARTGYKFLYAPARNSTMYRHSFGNAIAVKTSAVRIVDFKTQDCLTEPTAEENGEGRAAAVVVLEPAGGGKPIAVCCTHLTEKQVGEQGQKQVEQIQALLDGSLADAAYADMPMVLCGDFNINNVGEQPPATAAFCRESPFLHPHADHDPYDRLAAAGFKGGQHYAQAQDL